MAGQKNVRRVSARRSTVRPSISVSATAAFVADTSAAAVAVACGGGEDVNMSRVASRNLRSSSFDRFISR